MKTCSNSLAQSLNSASEFVCCDLFKWELSNGSIYYIADYDKDVVYNNNTYSCSKFLMERGTTKATGTPTVDSLTITVRADRDHSDNIGGKYILLAAHDGTLDNSYITLSRAFFDKDTNAFLGVLELFTGRAEVSSCGGLGCSLTCKSECTGLNANVPVRTFAPQNVYEQTEAGGVVTSSQDSYTCMIPLKPSRNVLIKL